MTQTKERVTVRKHWTLQTDKDLFYNRLAKVKSRMPKHYIPVIEHSGSGFLVENLKSIKQLIGHGYPKNETLLQELETFFPEKI